MTRRALVLGGAGMLAPTTRRLARAGWHVVLPSRRYVPIPAEGTGRAIWVRADWSAPHDVADRAAAALAGPADLLIAWLPAEDRVASLAAMRPSLAPDCGVVEVHSSVTRAPEAALDLPTQHLVLGEIDHAGRTRRPRGQEIADAVAEAVDRALTCRPPGVHYLGEPRLRLAG